MPWVFDASHKSNYRSTCNKKHIHLSPKRKDARCSSRQSRLPIYTWLFTNSNDNLILVSKFRFQKKKRNIHLVKEIYFRKLAISSAKNSWVVYLAHEYYIDIFDLILQSLVFCVNSSLHVKLNDYENRYWHPHSITCDL